MKKKNDSHCCYGPTICLTLEQPQQVRIWFPAMINNEFLKALSEKISGVMPVAGNVKSDVQETVYKTMQQAFAQLNIVTREEFDTQLKVLQRAQQTISELEAKIEVLENEVKGNNNQE